MTPKKLLFIAWDMDFSKSAALVGGMVKNPYYLYSGIGSDFEKKYLTTSKNESFFISGEKERVNTNYLAALPKYLIRCFLLSRAIKRNGIEPDIIHAHTPALVPLFYPMKKSHLIITAHGTHWPEFKANHKVKSLKSFVIYVNAYLQFCLEKKIYSIADKVISVSEFQVKELIDDYEVEKSKVEVIQNGINFEIYRPSDESEKDREFDVLFVGRPVPKKGIDVLVSAIDIAQKRLKRSISSQWVFGQGWVSEPNVSEEFSGKISGIGGKILNHVPEAELPASYRRSKILVVPSLGYESLPTVLMEGLGCGTVPLASRSFGNVELLPEELLFAEGDCDEIAGKIVSILENLPQYQKKANAISLEKYDLKRCVNAHEMLYMKVCNEK